MKILGISGNERHAAAAVSIDGTIVAAATEDSFIRVLDTGYGPWGRYPLAAVESCLTRARLSAGDIDRVVVVDDRVSGSDDVHRASAGLFAGADRAHIDRVLNDREHALISPAVADARQIAWDGDAPFCVQVLSEPSDASTFDCRGALLTPVPDPTGATRLLCAIARMTQALGVGPAGYAEVERLAALAGDVAGSFDRALFWNAASGVDLNDREFARAIQPLRDSSASGTEFDGALSEHVVRERIAAAFCSRVNTLIAAIVERLAARYGDGRFALAGNLLANRGIATAAIAASRGSAIVAAVPDPSGRALGAALKGAPRAAPVDTLALGPEFSESDIKLALENCRLDYLYEPDWPRLLARTSKMLGRGSVVAWFQGPTGFGPRSIGTRSILCDPSNRYARENINRFLRHARVEDSLPVAMTQAAAGTALADFFGSPFMPIDATVHLAYRDRLRAAVDSRGTAPVRVVTERQAPALFELLEVHRQVTGVPGLVDVALAGAHEPCASTPRDAIRTTFSSAVDAIVIGRFLLMKDYWLLRSGTDA